MLNRLKSVSTVGLGAVLGFGVALLGAFFGWILFPFLVSINVDKVNINLKFI